MVRFLKNSIVQIRTKIPILLHARDFKFQNCQKTKQHTSVSHHSIAENDLNSLPALANGN